MATNINFFFIKRVELVTRATFFSWNHGKSFSMGVQGGNKRKKRRAKERRRVSMGGWGENIERTSIDLNP